MAGNPMCRQQHFFNENYQKCFTRNYSFQKNTRNAPQLWQVLQRQKITTTRPWEPSKDLKYNSILSYSSRSCISNKVPTSNNLTKKKPLNSFWYSKCRVENVTCYTFDECSFWQVSFHVRRFSNSRALFGSWLFSFPTAWPQNVCSDNSYSKHLISRYLHV